MITYINKIPPSYYGGLYVKEEEGKFYSSIENYSGFEWVEIPEYLYDALILFQTEG